MRLCRFNVVPNGKLSLLFCRAVRDVVVGGGAGVLPSERQPAIICKGCSGSIITKSDCVDATSHGNRLESWGMRSSGGKERDITAAVLEFLGMNARKGIS